MKILNALAIASIYITNVVAQNCWANKLSYRCCSTSDADVVFKDGSGEWAIENGDWCGIIKEESSNGCWANDIKYECCESNDGEVYFIDDDGKWGIENGSWCGIIEADNKTSETAIEPTETVESTETNKPVENTTSSPIRDIPSKELIKEMKFGWNLGNTLDAQCIDNLDYEKDQTASETCWGNPKTTEDMFKVLMDNQFNVFRIPTTWSGHFGEAPDYKINEKWLKRVHEVVDYAYKNGAFVILNIHHETWNHAFSETLETAKEILEKIWTQIAEEFKDYDEHLIFEGLNEPRKNDTPVEWNGGDQEGWDAVNAMNAVFLKTIRSSGGNNSKRHLMIPPYAAACNENAFKNYIFPEDDDKVIASVHAYQPYNFALNNGEGAVDKFDAKGKNELDWNLGIMKKRFVDQGIPMILGEYGAMNRDNDEERAKWAEYYMEKVTAMGVPQVWWDNGIFEGEGERFGIFDRSNLKIVYPGIVAALQKGRGLEVNVVHAAEAKPKPEPTEVTTEATTEATESTETTVPINPSTGIRDISSKELIKEMKFGWNLGNTLDAQCIDNLDYEKDQTASETCWGNPKTTEDMFKVLMDNQFNVFRIPTTWSGHFGEAPDYKINEKWLKRVHEVVDYAYKNGAFVILNIHHETWNHAFSETLETAKEILEKIWTQIAEEFKDYDEHLIFEGLNEPRKNDTPVEWNGGDQEGWDAVNAMNAVFLKTIRSSGGNNSKRHLMIPPYAAACNENAFKNYIFPEDDDKVIASVHAYQPYNFALNNGEGAVDKFDSKGKNELDWNLGIMKKRFVDQGIPMILGEYGAMNRDNDEERAKWAEYYMEKVTAMGVPQVWWDNGIFEGEGERFGIFDRSNLKIVYPGIVAALQKGRGLEVNVVHAAEAKPKPETTEATTEVTTEAAESTETTVPINPSTGIRDISSKELIKEMKFGWNLGNTLDAQCIDNLDYEKDQTASETCWGNPKTTEDMFKVLMDNQFNVFRIPTTWSGHFGEAPDYKINEKWLKRVHEVVDYAYKNGAFVILNIHHETWNHAFSETLETAKEILEKIWTQIAEEFKDYDEHLIFEGLNEPRKNDTPVEWNGGDQEGWDAVNAMNAVFLKTIRSSGGNNLKRHLMIPPYAAACNENAFKNYIFPEDDDKVIASVHAYQPYNFALNNGEGAVDKFDAKGKNELDWNLGIMKKRFVDQGIPMILGEYGAMNRDNDEERAKWAEYYMEKVTAMGVPQVWWDNGIFEGEGERFGIFDRSNLKIVYPGIVAALQKGRGLEVNVVHAAEAKPKPETTEATTEVTTEAAESTETTVPINPSTGIRDISSKELIKEMKFGWNLGNTLDAQCIDNLDYEKDQTASETCWGNPKTTEDMFKVLMDNQFNVFRIPTTWSGHFGEAPDYKINEKWLKRVHEVVDYAYKNGAFVILNIHHETWNHAFSETLETAKEILEKIWTQIAEEFKDYDEHLIFEGLNEPRKNDTPVEWNGGDQEGWDAVNAMNAVFLKTIRSSGGNNSKRHLMIPPYAAACNENAFKNYIFPEDDDKVIASVHAYQPYNFALNNGEGAVDKFDSKGKNELDWNLGIMKKRFVDQGIPMILGEYGAMNRDNDEERAKWAEYYMEKVTAMGVPQVWWDNGIFEGEGERFGIFDRSNLKIVYPGIVAALQKGRGLEVNVVHAAEAKPKPEPTEVTTEATTEATESTETTVPINPSTGIRDISSKELIKEMKFGWNLGNTLDAQCIDNLDYEKDQTASETCWGNPKTTEDMFKVLMDNQFNVFRIPTTWSGHFGEAPDYKINEKWLKRVHEVVDYAYKNGAFVILNIHHETWNHAFSETLETAKEILEKIWTQIAEEFKDYDEHLIFEGLNEPRKNDTPVEWNGGDQEGWDAVNAMNAVFLKTIRSSGGNNSKRHLMIPPYAAACNENAFKNYIFPEDDDKVIASVHAYQPYNFALNNGEGAVDKFDAKGKNELDWNLGIMKKRFVDQGIPMILGEYGAMNRDNDEERAKWAEYYMEKVTAMGVPQVWWDNGIFEGEGERFGIFDRSNLKIVYPGIVAALQKGRGLEVNVVHAAETKPKEEKPKECWSKKYGYECCSSENTRVVVTDETGKWGVENGQWCGVLDYTEACWSLPFGYKCCTHCKVLTKDENGKWGEEKGEWCGIIEEKC